MSNWQPIETAPKDGTTILVYHKKTALAIFVVWWDARKGRWEDTTGWWSDEPFSHWQPLPDPPTGTERVLQS